MGLEPSTQNEHGFTMVEMMVVVMIIGILAAIAIPLYLEQRKSAYESVLKSDLHNVGTQIASGHNDATGGFKTPVLAGSPSINKKTSKAVHLSPGVTISFRADRDAFCIVGSHVGDPSNTWAYSYRDGGVVKTANDCSTLPQIGDPISAGTPSGPIAAPAPTTAPTTAAPAPTVAPTTPAPAPTVAPTTPAPAPSPSATTAPTTPAPAPSPSPTERHTGDLYTDTPISPNDQCFPEMMTINRLFNESIVWRTPASMMLYADWSVNGGNTRLNRYYAHPDYIKKMELYDQLAAAEKYVSDRPVLQAEYDRRNDEMNANYAKFPKELALDNYNAVTFNYIRSGGSPTATPNKAIVDAFEAHRHLIHQWNYVQCAEYAYPGHALYKDDRR